MGPDRESFRFVMEFAKFLMPPGTLDRYAGGTEGKTLELSLQVREHLRDARRPALSKELVKATGRRFDHNSLELLPFDGDR